MTDDPHLGPPPVEPMSDVAWARVERGLWSRIDSGATDALPAVPRRRWLWVAMPALAVAAVFALLIGTGALGSQDDDPVITSAGLDEPSRVVAGAAPSAVSFGDAHIELAAQSAIVMTREGGSPSVLLERGLATFAVAPRADRPAFVVRAGDTVVRVVGTRFSVSRSDEQITVTVEHGLVDVQFRGATQRVGGGHSWSSDAPSQVALYTPAPAPAAPTPDTSAAIPPPGPSDTRAPNPSSSGSSDTRTAGTHTTDTRTPDPHTTDTHTADTRTLDTHTADPRTGTPDNRVVPPPTTDAEAVKYDRLTALEGRDPAAALAGYLELSRGNTKWSGVALYAAARLAADRNDRRAATLLTIYLRRFPNGANADDARNLLARLKGDVP